jgi:hypothetical protein
MYKLKGCPRCRGDLLLVQVDNFWSEQCIQCGYERDLKLIAEVTRGKEPSKK